jgi:hypothetical protein
MQENVAVFYNPGGVTHGNALRGTWLRLQLSNVGLIKATGCVVYVTSVARNSAPIETDSSELEWTDEDPGYRKI